MLKDFARTLAIHRRGLLAWYRYPISTGPLDGTNNKIRAFDNTSLRLSDTEFFILRLSAFTKPNSDSR